MPAQSTPSVCSVGGHRILVAAFQCFEEVPKVDYDKLAALMNWTRGSAQSNWSRAKNAIMGENAAAMRANCTKRKADADTDTTTDRKDSTSPQPAAKKGRKPKKKPFTTTAANDDNDDDEIPQSIIPARPIKRQRKVIKQSGVEDDGVFGERGEVKREVRVKDEPREEDDEDEELGGDFLKELEAFAQRAES